MIKKLMIWILVAIIGTALVPAVLGGLLLAIPHVLGCRVHEGVAHGCALFGHDLAPQISVLFTGTWLGLLALPSVLKALAVWIAAALILAVMRWRRRSAAQG